MGNNLFNLFRNSIQTGFVLGILMIILEIIIQYLFPISLLSIILVVCLLVSLPLLVYLKKIKINRSRQALFFYFSKVYQVGFLILFVFKIYLHQYVDVNLKYKIASNKVSEMRNNLMKVEVEHDVVIENKEENMSFIYDDVASNYSFVSLLRNYLITVFILIAFSFFGGKILQANE
jgi:hypothetical protein